MAISLSLMGLLVTVTITITVTDTVCILPNLPFLTPTTPILPSSMIPFATPLRHLGSIPMPLGRDI